MREITAANTFWKEGEEEEGGKGGGETVRRDRRRGEGEE